MRERFKGAVSLLLVLLLLPCVCTILINGMPAAGVAKGQQEGAGGRNPQGEAEENMETYLVGVVAGEIPVTCEGEAIKAQAVIARTNLQATLSREGGGEYSYLSVEEMEKLWGKENFLEYYEYVRGLVLETKGEILTYGGKAIDAPYHAVSAGWTRDGDVLGGGAYPWLARVDCRSDVSAEQYLKIEMLSPEEFQARCQAARGEIRLGGDAAALLGQVAITERDEGGYVLGMEVGGLQMKGEEFRRAFGLNSSCFYLDNVEGEIRIITKGLGHGLGLSQWKANDLAKEGKNYREILGYFYQNVEVQVAP